MAKAYANQLSANLDLRNATQELFGSRVYWAKEFLKLIQVTKQIGPDDVPLQTVRQFQMLGDSGILEAVKTLWSNAQSLSSTSKEERMAKVASILSSGTGNQ
ncbi:MAG: hypothetical protein QM485_11970 [Flavobacteriaceae bacterium]